MTKILLASALATSLGTGVLAQDQAETQIGFSIKEQIACTDTSVRKILHIPQIHTRPNSEMQQDGSIDGTIGVLTGGASDSLIWVNDAQKGIVTILENTGSQNIFSEGYTQEAGEISARDQRRSRINNATRGMVDGLLEFERNLSGNRYDQIRRIDHTISQISFLWKRISIHNEQSKSVSEIKANSNYDGNSSVLDLLEASNDSIEATLRSWDEKLRQEREKVILEIQAERDKENERLDKLLDQYPYAPGADLYLAEQGKINIQATEDTELNKQANNILRELKRARSNLLLAFYDLERYDIENPARIFEKGQEKFVNTLGLKGEYQVYIEALQKFDEVQEERDDFAVEAIANFETSDFEIPLIYGAAHDFRENVEQYNKSNPDAPVCLHRVDI